MTDVNAKFENSYQGHTGFRLTNPKFSQAWKPKRRQSRTGSVGREKGNEWKTWILLKTERNAYKVVLRAPLSSWRPEIRLCERVSHNEDEDSLNRHMNYYFYSTGNNNRNYYNNWLKQWFFDRLLSYND